MSKTSYHEVINPKDTFDEGELLSLSSTPKETPSLSSIHVNTSSSHPSSINIFKDGEEFLQNSVKKCNGVLLQGPRRLMKLCIFGLILPVMLIGILLYVRIILYPPFHFTMAPTDQRPLEQTSSIWCQGQTVHMNGSFNAYLMPEPPRTKSDFSTHSMLQHVKLKDDVKEYWGFFLQKGSIVSINLCARHDGGMLMIMRGVNNLKKCAWIGEEDSAEQDEDEKDTSNESGQREGVSHDFPMVPGEILMETDRSHAFMSRGGYKSIERVNLTSEERREELDYYIKKVIKLSKNRKEILKGIKKHRINVPEVTTENFDKFSLLNVLLNSTTTVESKLKNVYLNKTGEVSSVETKIRKQIANKTGEDQVESKLENKYINNNTEELEDSKHKRIRRLRRYLERNEDNKLDEANEQEISFRKSIYSNVANSSYEVTNATREIYLSLFNLPKELNYERGNINQSFNHDRSNEEHRSSFSSSEEALTKCEGLIGLLPLYASRKCKDFNDSHTNKIRYKIPVTGTYYFVFSSDNEVFDVDMFFNMTLERVVFDTEASIYSCVNKTNCSLEFSFWSHDQAIVEVPEGNNWNNAYTLEIKCQPRVTVYLTFLFLTPILILFCAFH